MAERDIDIAVFGATGFVGRLVSRYLAEHAPQGLRVALAGRTPSKLEAVRSGLPLAARDWPLVVADSTDSASLIRLAEASRVVLTTVGPYAVVERGCRVIGSQIKDTIVMADSVVHDSQLQDSILGERVVTKGYVGNLNIGDDSQVIG